MLVLRKYTLSFLLVSVSGCLAGCSNIRSPGNENYKKKGDKMVLYSVHDVVADTWSFPQVSPNAPAALRDFVDLTKKSGVPGSDLDLVQLGEFDPLTGDIKVNRRILFAPDRVDKQA